MQAHHGSNWDHANGEYWLCEHYMFRDEYPLQGGRTIGWENHATTVHWWASQRHLIATFGNRIPDLVTLKKQDSSLMFL